MESALERPKLSQVWKKVSIPFKREGTWKVVIEGNEDNLYSSFNSLQTGRYMERNSKGNLVTIDQEVSIPFKREGTWKDIVEVADADTTRIRVSIPFKREGTWKAVSFTGTKSSGYSFQFPSNGKVHGKGQCDTQRRVISITFQFPSNGKVHGKKAEKRMSLARM